MFKTISPLKLIALMFSILVIGACSDNDEGPGPTVVTQVQVTTEKNTFPAGVSQMLSATATYSDNHTIDASGYSSTWTSTDETIATVDESGLVTGVSSGTTTINASYEGVIGSISITITAATLVDVEIQPYNIHVPLGLPMKYLAIGIYSDSSKHSLNNNADIIWSSSNTAVATIDNDHAIAKTLSLGETTITVATQGLQSDATLYVTDEKLVSLMVSPVDETTAPAGYSLNFIAEATYTDDSIHLVTEFVDWHSDNSTVLYTTADHGTFLARTAGEANISANFEAKTSNIVPVTVSDALLESVVLSSKNTAYPVGTSESLIAYGNFSDTTQHNISQEDNVHWISSNPEIATINDNGLFKAISIGAVTITVNTDEGFSDTKDLTVTPAEPTGLHLIEPEDRFIPPGESQQYIVIQSYTDGTKHIANNSSVGWYLVDEISGNSYSDAASISNQGVLTTVNNSNEDLTLKLQVKAYINGVPELDEVYSYIGAVKTLQVSDEQSGKNLSYIGPFTFEDSRIVGMNYTIYDHHLEDGLSGPNGIEFIKLTYSDAEKQCNQLIYNKHSDYRLPSIDELTLLWNKYDGDTAGPYELYTEQNWSVGVPFWTIDKADKTEAQEDTFRIFNLAEGVEAESVIDNNAQYFACVRDNN